ncbi:hypothetical protein DY262_02385 [Hydrogenophaga borbori]|uniref:Sulfatase N-terminal domain-containing protein n=1 Tax=Hydrogenophaga borbori TaxID=2294117 RepID=A0A372EQ70_9BURK|nr:hypothetical protein [Hydrogenophaga borbori]RFP82692.1 hypothetical protein DY262_02385 [Hydrogenophaga borbori]
MTVATAGRAALAFVLLNTLLTFENRWPGLGVRFMPRLSFELCLGLALLAAWVAWRGAPTARATQALALGAMALAAARYADVTAPAMLGRPVNLYWDGRFALDLVELAARSWPAWQLAVAALAVALGAALLLALARWAIGALSQALSAWPALRRGSLLSVTALSLCFAAYAPGQRDTRWFFSLPLAPTLWNQATLFAQVLGPGGGEAALGTGPAFDTDLQSLQGVGGPADVLLLFAESYGAVALDDAALSRALAPARERLQAAIDASGRRVLSARVRAATFGGASWLSHASLLSGLAITDPARHNLLMTSQRPTLVSHFARHGYRTVGWMPGIKRPWPEGAFYGFERFADDAHLGYRGPDIGYWRIPDQVAMALLHAQELSAPPATRRPVFAVFPTVSTHAPFQPLPALLDDPLRGPPTGPAGVSAGAGYPEGLRYQFRWLARHLERTAGQRLVLIVVGDHQPPGGVAGRDAPWDVPVHLITSDATLARRFQALGFTPGLQPQGPALGAMHDLTRWLLLAFDGRAEPH